VTVPTDGVTPDVVADRVEVALIEATTGEQR
jgi:hypothetical protein